MLKYVVVGLILTWFYYVTLNGDITNYARLAENLHEWASCYTENMVKDVDYPDAREECLFDAKVNRKINAYKIDNNIKDAEYHPLINMAVVEEHYQYVEKMRGYILNKDGKQFINFGKFLQGNPTFINRRVPSVEGTWYINSLAAQDLDWYKGITVLRLKKTKGITILDSKNFSDTEPVYNQSNGWIVNISDENISLIDIKEMLKQFTKRKINCNHFEDLKVIQCNLAKDLDGNVKKQFITGTNNYSIVDPTLKAGEIKLKLLQKPTVQEKLLDYSKYIGTYYVNTLHREPKCKWGSDYWPINEDILNNDPNYEFAGFAYELANMYVTLYDARKSNMKETDYVYSHKNGWVVRIDGDSSTIKTVGLKYNMYCYVIDSDSVECNIAKDKSGKVKNRYKFKENLYF